MVTDTIGAMNNSTISSKECRRCGEVKLLSAFGIHPGFPDGHRNQCKACVRLRNIANGHMAKGLERFKQWVKDNPERQKAAAKNWVANNRDRMVAATKRWRDNHPEYAERRRELARTRYAENREQICAEVKAWCKKNRHKIRPYRRKWEKLKRDTDPAWKLKKSLRVLLYAHIRGIRKSASAMQLLGCSLEDFWLYLENQFKPGWTRENYGKVWEIDHLIPLDDFDLSKAHHQKRAFHFSNLRPLAIAANRSKRAKIVTNQYNLL